MFYVCGNSCKVCCCEYNKARRRNLAKDKIGFLIENNIYHKDFNNSGTKRQCKKCGLIDEDIFFKNNVRCNECFALARRNAVKKNRDNLTDSQKKKIRQRMKRYRSTPEYKEKHAAISQKWRDENREEALKISREQYKKHGERYNAIRRKRLKTDKEYREKIRKKGREYSKRGKRKANYWKNPEHYRAITKKNRSKYKDKIAESTKKWRKENIELCRLYSRIKVSKLLDSYLRSNIHRRELIATKDITEELIELERERLKLSRAVRT